MKESIQYVLFERDSEDVYWNKSRDWGIVSLFLYKKYIYPFLITYLLVYILTDFYPVPGMQLHWGKEYLLGVLPEHIQSHWKDATVDPHYDADEPLPHINGATGEIIAGTSFPGVVRVSRKKLRKLLGWRTQLNIKVCFFPLYRSIVSLFVFKMLD